MADRYRPEFEDWLSARMNQPIQIEKLSAEWTATGPQLKMLGLQIGNTEQLGFKLDAATFSYDIYAWIKPTQKGATSFQIVADQLIVNRNPQGVISIKGLSQQSDDTIDLAQRLRWLKQQSSIRLRAKQLIWEDQLKQKNQDINQLEITFDNAADQLRLTGSFMLGNSPEPVEFIVEHQLSNQHTRWYAKTENTELSTLQGLTENIGIDPISGHLNFQLWGDWYSQGRTELRGLVNIDNAVFAGSIDYLDEALATRFNAEIFSTAFRAEWLTSGDLALRFNDTTIDRNGRSTQIQQIDLSRQYVNATPYWSFSSDHLKLNDIAEAATVIGSIPDQIKSWAYQLAPGGQLKNIFFKTDPSGIRGGLDFNQFSNAAFNIIPGISGIDGSIEYENNLGSFKLNSTDSIISIPKVFRESFLFEQIKTQGQFELKPDKNWAISIDQLNFVNEGIEAVARLNIKGDESPKPFVDIGLNITRPGNVQFAQRFWPYRVFSTDLIDWLDHALEAGQVSSGKALIFGDLDDWPFRQNQGLFLAEATVSDATLDFHQDWPKLTEIEAEVSFNGVGLTAEASNATMAENSVSKAQVSLAQYSNPVLKVQGAGSGSGRQLLSLLRQSPVQDDYGEYLDGLTIEGEGKLGVDLTIPLTKRLGEPDIDGWVDLSQCLITDSKWDLALHNAGGRIHFTENGFQASELKADFNGYEAQLDISSGSFVESPETLAAATLSSFSPASVIKQRFPELAPILDQIKGKNQWQAGISVNTEDRPVGFKLQADLSTKNIDLPAPLNSFASSSIPVTVNLDMTEPLDALDIQIGQNIHFLAKRIGASGDWGANIHFGLEKPAQPNRPGIAVSGQVDTLDADGWIDFFNQLSSEQSTPPEQRWIDLVDLNIQNLTLMGREFQGLTFSAQRGDAYWAVHIDGEQAKGSLRLPLEMNQNRLLLAEFDHLIWPDGLGDGPNESFDPSLLPPLQFYAKNLSFLEKPLGDVRFETYPTAEGMRIAGLQTQSDAIQISASGDWLRADTANNQSVAKSQFAGTITAEDLGLLLEEFGFSRVIDSGQLIARLDADWPGSPSEFDWNKLNGELDISVGRGQLVEVEPGAGRIFGLLSVQALPRRLLLDFSDLFKSGLSFDTISGQFILESGQANTDNLLLKGPTAQILIAGRTGLADQDYDQVITVIPKVGDTLPLVGAIAGGGAAGAAALFVIQNVFKKQINKITQYQYSITGSWDTPEIELIGANDTRLEIP